MLKLNTSLNWKPMIYLFFLLQNQSPVQRHRTDCFGQSEAALFYRQRWRDIPLYPELPENQQTASSWWLQGNVHIPRVKTFIFIRFPCVWNYLKLYVSNIPVCLLITTIINFQGLSCAFPPFWTDLCILFWGNCLQSFCSLHPNPSCDKASQTWVIRFFVVWFIP